MNCKTLSLLLAVFFFIRHTAQADTFIVTSNADNGAGTLREAITLANANGAATFDTILFNLPDITQAGRTITLQSELPTLSSKIIIDGSSQPGATISISNAKVILYLDHFTPLPFTFLFIANAADIKIFGLCFRFFDNPDAGGGLNYGVGIRNSADIVIGGPGKGNLFSCVRSSITNNYWNYFLPDSLKNLTVQGNVFGVNPFNNNTGRGFISLITSATILIGGDLPEEGNIFTSAGIYLSQLQNKNLEFFAKVLNNRFGSNWDGSSYFYDGGSIDLWGNITDDTLPMKTIVRNNFIVNGHLGLHQLYHKAIVQGNKFGTDITGTNCIGVSDIGAQLCRNLIIGGHLPEEQNIIHGNIYTEKHGTHVIKNKISGIISIGSMNSPVNDPYIKITGYDNNLITGEANPNAKIQLYTDRCDVYCLRRVYYATTYANSSGQWTFTYANADPNFVATATMTDSSTSEFTQPIADHYTYRIIKDATCGRSNGSITGVKVYAGTHIRWYDATTMQLVGTDTNLVNVPAGSYVLTVTNGENGCPFGANFVINDLQPPPTVTPSITDASCGMANGSISTFSFSYGSKWMNNNMDSIGTGPFINNLLPGTYYLKIWIATDTSCNRTYGPFAINNQSGPSLNTNNIQITNATCNNSNGSIRNITANNVTGSPFIQWVDSLNNVVSNMLDLLNKPAGEYKLKFKDQSGCDTIITPFYIIPATGKITIDTAGKIITKAGCTINNGSIRNIKVIGADTYQWHNLTTNAPAGNTIDVYNLTPGNYQLTATNVIGCSAVSPVINVPQSVFIPIGVTGSQTRVPSCGQNNGMLRITSFNNDSNLYSFRWIDSASNQQLATGTALYNIGPGTYLLMATDSNGCEKQITKSVLGAWPKPTFDLSGMSIKDDKCARGEGSISGIRIKDFPVAVTYTWKNASNTIVGNALDLLNVPAGQYYLTVTDGILCTIQSDILTVLNTNDPGIVLQYDNPVIPRNTAATLTIKNFRPGTYFLYSDPAGNQLLQQNTTGVFATGVLTADADYYIKFVSGACTSSVAHVKVTVVDKSFFAIASAFTPNSDGRNDRLDLKVIGYIDVEYFRIFNRNGEEVFSTKTINHGWDGKYNGTSQPTGVFVWMAKGKDINGKVIRSNGTFVLIR